MHRLSGVVIKCNSLLIWRVRRVSVSLFGNMMHLLILPQGTYITLRRHLPYTYKHNVLILNHSHTNTKYTHIKISFVKHYLRIMLKGTYSSTRKHKASLALDKYTYVNEI